MDAENVGPSARDRIWLERKLGRVKNRYNELRICYHILVPQQACLCACGAKTSGRFGRRGEQCSAISASMNYANSRTIKAKFVLGKIIEVLRGSAMVSGW